MARKLGDRVSRWIMLNEPQVTAHRGFAYGKYAPGFADRHKFFAVTHHQNLAQGDAVRALRAVNSEFDLGTVFNLSVPVAASDSEDDQRAAVVYDSMWNRNFLDPLFKGSYPDLGEADLRPFLQRGDMERIAQPIDFLGLNYYCRSFCKWDENHPLKVARSSPVTDLPRTCLDWEILPSGMTEMLLRLRDEYGNPTVYISENGAAFYEADVEAAVSDVARVDFLDGYLRAAHRAVEAGVNLKGYFVWSIIDNFEWAWGYAPRFGIVHVDYDTQTRTPKQSYHWYATVAQQNALPIRNED
jgi:beta-glucosidase